MKLVGVDLSLTSTGIVTLDDGQPIQLQSSGWGGEGGASYAERAERIVAMSRHVLGLIPADADAINIEGPAYASQTGHFFDRGGLFWGVFAGLHARSVPIVVTPPTTLKMWATGNGAADKKAVKAATALRWPDIRIRTFDEADALCLAEILAAGCGVQLPFRVTDRHWTNIAKVAWPKQITPITQAVPR